MTSNPSSAVKLVSKILEAEGKLPTAVMVRVGGGS